MPIYGYVCNSCEHTLDALQKIADDPLVDCPACGEAALKRQLSAPRFRLKGQGWYETDFKQDKQRNLYGEKEPSTSGDAADKKDDAKADTKTDAKSEKKADTKADTKSEKKAAKKTDSTTSAA
ncbi:MAG: zinc ribbon domain-containing protein [Woeseiaceae bacterium]|nr:zinc ribbon domain-containing protein [Woeseiaceae bacterium]